MRKIREYKIKGFSLVIVWGENTEEAEIEIQSGLSRFASHCSWNSYLYSISPCVRFWIFNILLFGVDGKGHKLFRLILVAYLFASNPLWSFPLAWAHLKIMRCGFIGFLLFLLFLFYDAYLFSPRFLCFGSFLQVSWWLSISIPYEPILLGR